ncbi:hypothetical protein EK904_014257 [Melospiza melodia maxima]|nr:hypothetical protein EK904_014257 [Melospiza melodia maxima]
MWPSTRSCWRRGQGQAPGPCSAPTAPSCRAVTPTRSCASAPGHRQPQSSSCTSAAPTRPTAAPSCSCSPPRRRWSGPSPTWLCTTISSLTLRLRLSRGWQGPGDPWWPLGRSSRKQSTG